jgi:2-polyprenyl-3-methyl-5-hydroxy-6-metoxy-1,4-benzoquinol methylase
MLGRHKKPNTKISTPEGELRLRYPASRTLFLFWPPEVFVPSENAVSFHSKQAGTWEAGYSSRTFSMRMDVLENLLRAHNLTGKYWLDAGCGTGTLARWLAERKGCDVLGVDASAEMIDKCDRAPGTAFRTVRDICDLPIDDSTFDGILCSSVIEYTRSPEEALGELRRVIKRGGLLLISVPNANLLARLPQLALNRASRFLGRELLSYLTYSKWSYSSALFSRLLNGCGFVVCDQRKFGEVRVRNFRINGDGTMIMFLATAA